jgi:5'-nucleotidase
LTDLPRERGIFCNRTLNLNAIRAIGYDLDYTLVHYHVDAWEERAFFHVAQQLAKEGWPVETLKFDMQSVCRGLVIDLELGNVLKVNRFGYVKAAQHGSRKLDFGEMRTLYLKTLVDISLPRYAFLETLFSISEACIFIQLVDLLDAQKLKQTKIMSYADLHRKVRAATDLAHMEGLLKADIMANPAKFVSLDPEVTKALQDQRAAGKKVMLITNSEWEYANAMLTFALNPYMPEGQTWRDLFDLAIVGARKPDFFKSRVPIFELVSEDGLLRPVAGKLKEGAVYLGGNAFTVEKFLGLTGDSILYVGDHIFSDVIISKTSQEWRTAMVIREIEDEVKFLDETDALQKSLSEKMASKSLLEEEKEQLKVKLQRLNKGYGEKPTETAEQLKRRLEELRTTIDALDNEIAPDAIKVGQGVNATWGSLMRTGNDKSLLTRQVEKYADIYMSRVSNFYYATPFRYFRSPRAGLAHDKEI